MTKGTTSQGPRHLKAHTFCRRCGRRAYHRQKKICGALPEIITLHRKPKWICKSRYHESPCIMVRERTGVKRWQIKQNRDFKQSL